MAAPTNTYVDYAAGNDYKGTTFTDGAYTQATKNLNKTGAFTASQVGHWLYISGTHITTGYYKIATKTDNDNVVLATDASSDGSNSTDVACTQADGSIGNPWRSIQGALDLITRDATNGNQINVKAGSVQSPNASFTLATYGTPGNTSPLVLRGYSASAGDGGMAEIDCGGRTFWADSNYRYIVMADFEAHNFGNNNGISLVGYTENLAYRLEVHKGASSPTSKTLLFVSKAIGCYVHDAGTTGTGISYYSGGFAYGNYVYNCPNGISSGTMINNVVVDCTNYGINCAIGALGALCNTVYVSTAATGTGIIVLARTLALNNIVEGYSGSGGKGISTAESMFIGYTALFNNATGESLGDTWLNIGGGVALAASPFTDAAGGDFSLATGVAGAIDGAFPGAWYGPAGTTDHADIGAVQNGAGASTGAAVRIVPCGKVGL